MPTAERHALRAAYFTGQCSLGWAFPSALMQRAVPDLEKLTIDIAALTRRRDRMVGALTQWGYEVIKPEGTFYLFGRAPGRSEEHTSELQSLMRHSYPVFCLKKNNNITRNHQNSN